MSPWILLALALPFEWKLEQTIAAGIVYRHAEYRDAAQGPFSIHVLEFDPKTPGIDLIAVRAEDKLAAKETVSSMAQRSGALAAVNAGYFVVAGPLAGAPVSAYTLHGRLLSGSTTQVATGLPGAPLSGNPERTAMVLCQTQGEEERIEMDIVRFRGEVSVGDRKRALDGLNRPRGDSGLVVYTRDIGPSTRSGKDGVEAALDRDGHVVRLEEGFGNVEIPEGGQVLSAAREAADWIRANLRLGDVVKVNYGVERTGSGPACAPSDLVAAGPRLVRSGEIVTASEGFRHETARNPRTAIGVTASGSILLFVVDGRRADSVGMTIAELAQAMHALGAVDAMNLDGGGSTAMWVNGHVVNRPSDGRERAVSDGLVLRRR
ncbi:MAG: phosphodiester glycosidase family protein [Bryobacteraceae bacterium]